MAELLHARWRGRGAAVASVRAVARVVARGIVWMLILVISALTLTLPLPLGRWALIVVAWISRHLRGGGEDGNGGVEGAKVRRIGGEEGGRGRGRERARGGRGEEGAMAVVESGSRRIARLEGVVMGWWSGSSNNNENKNVRKIDLRRGDKLLSLPVLVLVLVGAGGCWPWQQ